MTSQPPLDQHLEICLAAWQRQVRQWAQEGRLVGAAVHALGLGEAPAALGALAGALARGDFSALPAVEVMADDELPGTCSYFSESQRTVFLNAAWLAEAPQDGVLTELTVRWGEHLDVVFNTSDTPGDEGRLFQALLVSADPTAPPR